MVEMMATGEVIILLLVAFASGYLTCSTIMLGDLEIEHDELKKEFKKVREEKEFLEETFNCEVSYRDVA